MSLPRKMVFALVPVLVLWFTIEGALSLAGISTVLDREDPFVGFEASVPLFVLDTSANPETEFVTASNKRKFFNAQHFAKKKPANTRRVFCLGGSTTYGRPYDDTTSFCGFARASLRAIEPDVNWEVVNAGGISYASYRVDAVADEIIRHEPDLFVVYTGHNEFLEERTYRGMRDVPPWRRALERRLRSFRSYALLEALLHHTDEDFAAKDRDTLSAEVETRLDSSVGLDAFTRDDELAANVSEHFRINLERIVRRARNAGAEVLLVVPAANLADSAPFKSQLSKTWTATQEDEFYSLLDTGIDALRNDERSLARRSLQQAVSLDPRYARARYEYGRLLFAEGKFDEARREFEAARDEDVCPLRARSEMVETVREVASRLDVMNVDFPALIDPRSGDGSPPPGQNWFVDHVHPTIEGNRVLARAILETLHESGWLRADPTEHVEKMETAEAGVVAQVDREFLGVSMRNLAKVLSWAGKTEEAARSAERALELLGDDAESFFILSLDATETGDHQRAIILLREALRLDPEWVKPRLNLGVELARVGNLEGALEAYDEVIYLAPDHPSVHYNLGRLLARMGRFEEAAAAFRLSLAKNPKDEAARFELASIETPNAHSGTE